ncbi:MAG: bifunctional adenosylcobinamide kinase/adenosylcobinamide-phosphate guanylyltransferase [Ilumatobacteraceae bacterium]
MGSFTLLLGGARSGKSTLAVEAGRRHGGDVVVIATAEPVDDDMAARIARHRAERPGWPVIEEPVRLADAIRNAPAEALVIVDCVTVWVANLLHHGVDLRIEPVVDALVSRAGPAVVISNEVGLGVVPASESGRQYRDLIGAANQRLAAAATNTLFMVAGRAVRLDDPWALL